MYCTYCGNLLDAEDEFCSNCGNTTLDEYVVEEQKESKCWTVFAKIGYGVSLAGLILSCIPHPYSFLVGMFTSKVGLVFSILGSNSSLLNQKAKKGRKMAIAGLIVSSAYTTILIIVFIIACFFMFAFLLFMLIIYGSY